MSVYRTVRTKLTYANVVATLALVVALTTGTAYAANEFTDANIVNGSLTQVDIATNGLGTSVIKDGGIKGVDVRDGELTGDDVADFSLSNEDINVFFAVVNSNGTLVRGTPGATSFRAGPGTYGVDLAHDVTQCAYLATVGNGAPASLAVGAVVVQPRLSTFGDVPTDLAVATSTELNFVDHPFIVVAIC